MTHSPPIDRKRRRLLKRWLWIAAGAALGLFAAQGWLLRGLTVSTASMEPFLHGDPQSGDRVAVLRFDFGLLPLRRLDLVVFEALQPDGARAWFVKRVAAFPGETVRIRGGDLWIRTADAADFELVRKSYREMKPLLVPLYVETFDGELERRLALDPGAARWNGIDLLLEAGAGDEHAAACRLRAPLEDGYLDGAGVYHAGARQVSDVLLAVDLTPVTDSVCYVAELRHEGDEFRFRVREEGGAAHLSIVQKSAHDGSSACIEAANVPFAAGRRHRIEVWNVDRQIGIAIDGEPLLRAGHLKAIAPARSAVGAGAPVFGLTEGRATVRAVALYRDLYYTVDPARHRAGLVDGGEAVPDGALFLLGDNSSVSEDSRLFGCVRQSTIVGKALAVYAPAARRRWLR